MPEEVLIRCAECGFGRRWHSLSCKSVTPEERIAVLENALKSAEMRLIINKRSWEYQKKQVAYWQGKHAVLRHENNQLRKQLRLAATEPLAPESRCTTEGAA